VTTFALCSKGLTEQQLAALKELVDEASTKGDEVIVCNAITEVNPDVENEVVLMVGTAATCSDPDLEGSLAKAANGARRVIWIWPLEGNGETLPAAAQKYAYSVITWDSRKLKEVAADDDVMRFEGPTGELLPPVPTERNVCVEDLAKAKGK
jgi:hypothetical protein